MLITDQWYVACPTLRLNESEPIAFRIWDQHLVAFRDQNGTAHVLLDRCAHRGARLSQGTVGKGCIACPYHGWQYNSAGEVIHVPSLGPDRSMPNYSTPSFITIEADHYVWVWIAGDHPEPTYHPRLHGIDVGTWVQRSAIWNCNAISAAENQLDSAHIGFAHAGLHPSRLYDGEMSSLIEGEFLTHVRATSVTSTWVVEPGRPPEETASPENPGLGFLSFELPYRNYVFLERQNIRAIINWVPLSDSQCRMELMTGPSDAQSDLEIQFATDEPIILKQDREILEGAQFWLDRNEEFQENVIADQAILAARELVQNALSGRVTTEAIQLRHRSFV